MSPVWVDKGVALGWVWRNELPLEGCLILHCHRFSLQVLIEGLLTWKTQEKETSMRSIDKIYGTIVYIYSQTCIKRPPMGRPKYGLLRQVVSQEGNLNYNVRQGEMKMWSHDRGGLSIEVVAQAGLTVHILNVEDHSYILPK